MARMDAAATTANMKVLLPPAASRVVVDSSNHVATGVVEFHGRLGIERGRQSVNARRWTEAAGAVRDKALQTGADGVGSAKRLGNETLDRTRSMTGKLSSRLAEHKLRRRGDNAEVDRGLDENS